MTANFLCSSNASSNRPFIRWRHFTAATRIFQDFAFLYKLGFCYLNLDGVTKFNMKEKTK